MQTKKRGIPDRGKMWASNIQTCLMFQGYGTLVMFISLQTSDKTSRWLELLPGLALSASPCLCRLQFYFSHSLCCGRQLSLSLSFMCGEFHSSAWFQETASDSWGPILVSASLKKTDPRPILLVTQNFSPSYHFFCFIFFCVFPDDLCFFLLFLLVSMYLEQ